VYQQSRGAIIMNVIFSVTFLSLFIIQKTMNHFSKALHIKMNELVAAHGGASNRLINVEDKTEEELQALAKHFSTLAKEAQRSNKKDGPQTIETILEKDGVDE
jgi:low affinity Fe/Cu permease